MTLFSFKKKLSKTGVTLTELLVVIAIITIISTIMVLNFRAGERGGELVRSAQLLVQGIRKAQNMALGSKEVENPPDPPGSGVYEVPQGGYGVNLEKDNNYFIIYADFSNNQKYTSGEKIETIELEEGITIEHIRYQPSNGTPSETNINFNPLDPLISLRPPIPPANEVNVTLKKEERTESCGNDCRKGIAGSCPTDCKVIKLLKGGWVSIVE